MILHILLLCSINVVCLSLNTIILKQHLFEGHFLFFTCLLKLNLCGFLSEGELAKCHNLLFCLSMSINRYTKLITSRMLRRKARDYQRLLFLVFISISCWFIVLHQSFVEYFTYKLSEYFSSLRTKLLH